MKRVLVTGATGYMGIRLCHRLCREGIEIHALVRPDSDLSRLPSAVSAVQPAGPSWEELSRLVADIRPDVVFHLATAIRVDSSGGPDPILAANLILGTRLCHALSRLSVGRLVNAASYWEYAQDGSYAPLTLYAATKRAQQDILEYYCRAEGLRAVSLVFFDIYGPGDWRDKFVPAVLSSMATGTPLHATGGIQRVDMVHVDDAVAGLLLAADRTREHPAPGHEIFALDSGERCTLRQCVAILAEAAGRPDPVLWGSRDYPRHQIFEPVEGLTRLPGWAPSIPLDRGFREVLAERGLMPEPAAGWPDQGP